MHEPLSFDVELPLPPDAAIEKVTAALKTEGFGVLTHIDVKATLQQKLGVEFRPYAILGACNPPIAHRALSQDPRIGLLLPCNVVVEAAGGGSRVRIGNPRALMNVGPLAGDAALVPLADEAYGKLQRVADLLRQG